MPTFIGKNGRIVGAKTFLAEIRKNSVKFQRPKQSTPRLSRLKWKDVSPEDRDDIARHYRKLGGVMISDANGNTRVNWAN